MTALNRKIHFITNGVFSTSIAGGDIHFFKLAEGAEAAGCQINYFGGHALAEVVRNLHAPGEVTLTDPRPMPKISSSSLRGQLTLFGDCLKRCRRPLEQLDRIRPDAI